MKQWGFPKSSRLLRRSDYTTLLRNRRVFRGQVVKIEYRRTHLPRPRLGLTISKKFGKAPARNLWKRRLREAFRLAQLPPFLDLNILPRQRAEIPSFQQFYQELTTFAHALAVTTKHSS